MGISPELPECFKKPKSLHFKYLTRALAFNVYITLQITSATEYSCQLIWDQSYTKPDSSRAAITYVLK